MTDVLTRPAPGGHEEVTGTTGRGWRLGRTWRRRARQLVAVVLPFFLWDWTAAIVNHRLLPGPPDVFQTLYDGFADGTIWMHAQITARNGLLGLTIAIAAGVVLGVLLARVQLLDNAVEPLVAATYPMPKLALYPLLVLVLGFGAAPKVAMVAIECGYPIVLTTYASVQAIDKHYFWLARNVEAGLLSRFAVMVRATTPSLVASMRMAAPIMLVIAVVTEMIGESRGLGYLIRQAGTDFDPEMAMAIILLLGLIGFVNDRLILFLSKRTNRWAPEVEL